MAKKSYYVYKDSLTGKIQRRLVNPIPHQLLIDKIKNMPVSKFFKGPMSEARKQMLAFMTTAFSLTAALFWNDAIKAMITSYIPKDGGWPYMMVAATVVTIIAVAVTWVVSKSAEQR
ncbi:MAG: hypothetical protein HY051_04475 [Candidatus Aenigmarchaeota archaeon]|nr:hypothetical protein [Candidatus Aenigmarchaeota archaeon]